MDSLICYMDILGFSNSIRQLNDQEIKKVLETLKGISKFFDSVKPLQKKHKTIESDMNIEFMECMSLDVFNDSILIIGDYPKIHWQKDDGVKSLPNFIFGSYFYLLVLMYIL